jgi:hypothetical protein
MRLDPNSFAHVTIETCIASSVGNGKNLQFLVVVAGNAASYKVTDHEEVRYEGPCSKQAAEVFNQCEDKAEEAALARQVASQLEALVRSSPPAVFH